MTVKLQVLIGVCRFAVDTKDQTVVARSDLGVEHGNDVILLDLMCELL